MVMLLMDRNMWQLQPMEINHFKQEKTRFPFLMFVRVVTLAVFCFSLVKILLLVRDFLLLK